MGDELANVVNEEERRLAAEATEALIANNLEVCAECLMRLRTMRPDDYKVQLNKLVVSVLQEEGRTNVGDIQKELAVADTLEQVDDNENKALLYNHAVLYHETKQFEKAVGILESLLAASDTLDDSISHAAALRLLDIHLRNGQLMAASALISRLDGTTGKENEQELSVTGRSQLQLYKVYHSILSRQSKNLQKTKGMTQPFQQIHTYLRCVGEALSGHAKKAVKMLPTELPPWPASGENYQIIHLNMQCWAALQQRRWQSANIFTKQALKAHNDMVAALMKNNTTLVTDSIPFKLVGISHHSELLYNSGLCLMHSGHYSEALEVFQQVMPHYQHDPRLWFHLAQCQLQQAATSPFQTTSAPLSLLAGSGHHRKLVGSSSSLLASGESTPLPSAMCQLQNSLLLIAAATDESHPLAGKFNVPLTQEECVSLRTNVLLCACYVSLCNSSWHATLRFASAASGSELTTTQRYLFQLYSAEANMQLDELADAISNLELDDLTDESPNTRDTGGDSSEDWDMSSERRRAVLLYNRACVLAVRGQLEKARSCLESAQWGDEEPALVAQLKLYLLMSDQSPVVVSDFVRHQYPQITPNRPAQ